MFEQFIMYIQTAWSAARREARSFGPKHRFFGGSDQNAGNDAG